MIKIHCMKKLVKLKRKQSESWECASKNPKSLAMILKSKLFRKKRVFLKDQTQFSAVQVFIMRTGLWSFELRLEADTRKAGTHTCTTQAQTTLSRAFYLVGQRGKTWVQSLPTERLELCRETILNIWPLSKYDKNNENKNRHFHAEDGRRHHLSNAVQICLRFTGSSSPSNSGVPLGISATRSTKRTVGRT